MLIFEFFFGIIGIVICAAALPLPLCGMISQVSEKRKIYLYTEGLLLCYITELFELLYIFCFLADKTYSDPGVNWIHFPLLRIGVASMFLIFDFLILLDVAGLSFKKWMLALFISFPALSTLLVLLPQSMNTVWGFYSLRQIYRLSYGAFFVIRFFTVKDGFIKKRMESFSFVALGCLVLTLLIALEDSMMLFHVSDHVKTPGAITERSFSETLLWIFISVCISVYCCREICFSKRSNEEKATPPISKLGSSTGISDHSPAMAFAKHYQLTQRETEIMKLLMQHMENAEICDTLFISIGTLKTHLHNIYTKTGAKSRTDLTRIIAQFISSHPLSDEK